MALRGGGTDRPLVMPAGKLNTADGESTAAAMTFGEAPETPPHIRKWRKSYHDEPGKRVIHPGRIEDEERKAQERARLPKGKQFFGSGTAGSEHVPDVLAHGPQTGMQEYLHARKEAVYRSNKLEPLGKAMSHGHELPERMKAVDFRFGIKSDTSESAKSMIAPVPEAETEEQRALYKRSHRSYEPGEQRTRGYRIPGVRDVREMTFGLGQGKPPEGRAAALALGTKPDPEAAPRRVGQRRVEEFRATQDRIGQTRNLMQSSRALPPNFVFGMRTSAADDWGVAECMRGGYDEEQLKPDPGLGKSVRPGWRNAANDGRSFGVPSIRSDVPKPRVRSVADHQNYGDDSTAAELLYPSRFSSLDIYDADFLGHRDVGELRDIFRAIGYELSDEEFRAVYARAQAVYAVRGSVGVESFRRALNEWDDAREEGELPPWWRTEEEARAEAKRAADE